MDVFLKLRDRLDELSVGFPATKSGVELQMLKKLFSPEEAEFFLLIGMKPEAPEMIAARSGVPVERASLILHEMAGKGLIFRVKKDQRIKYAAIPFIVGFYEFQLGRMDKEFAELFEQYWKEGGHQAFTRATSLMRPIPVNRSLDPQLSVSTYDNCREIVKSQKLIAVADCICRTQKGYIETACDKPLEVCLLFGSHGQAYIDLDIARPITVEEALDVLEKAERSGLVPQPANLQTPTAICNCCGDCCGILRSLNLLEKPAEAVLSNFFATRDKGLCTGCEGCLDRCQMKALSIDEDSIVSVNNDRCIGCGLCVTACPAEAIWLEEKAEEDQRRPQKSGMEMITAIAKKRGISITKILQGR